jgi:hypothetical protein
MPLISELARQISEATDIDSDPALTLATTYAAQCGYNVPEGGQEPDAAISDEDAWFILQSAKAAAVLDFPTSLIDDIADAVGRIQEAISDRDVAIRKAVRMGVPIRQIAPAAGLSRERIYQIRDHRR